MSGTTLDGFANQQIDDGFGGFDPLAMDMGDTDVSPTGFVDMEGNYYWVVTEVKPDEVKIGSAKTVSVKMQVLNSIPGQCPRGSVHNHRIRISNDQHGPPEEWAKKSAANFFCGIGVCRREQRGEKQVMICPDGTTQLKSDHWKMLVGRQCWGPIEKNEYVSKKDQTTKTSFEFKFGAVYVPWHEKFAGMCGPGQCGLPEELELAGCKVVNGRIVKVGEAVELGPNAGATPPTGASQQPAAGGLPQI